MTSPAQFDVITEHVKDALAKGARLLTGGPANRHGRRSFAATVLLDVDHSMRVMREETFGPVLPIMRVRDAEEAVDLANDSPYGLQASVFSRDHARAEAVAGRLECGVVCINDAGRNYSTPDLPMGGWKDSGLGTRHGAAGLRAYCRQQSLFITRRAPTRDPHMYPNHRVRTAALRSAIRLLGRHAAPPAQHPVDPQPHRGRGDSGLVFAVIDTAQPPSRPRAHVARDDDHHILPGGGMLRPVVLPGGWAAGTWGTEGSGAAGPDRLWFGRSPARRALEAEVRDVGRFLGADMRLAA